MCIAWSIQDRHKMAITRMNATVAASDIDPTTDVTYLGSFRIPDVLLYGGGWGMTYYPAGNSGAGSLFVVHGLEYYSPSKKVIEITIPTLVQSTTPSALNRATLLDTTDDISEGKIGTQLDDSGEDLGDVAFFNDYLYWVANEYYNPTGDDYPSIGRSDLDLSNLNSVGLYNVSPGDANRVGKYTAIILDTAWATANTSGKRLLVGRFKENGAAGSKGPALYAIDPSDTPPYTSTKLLEYDPPTGSHFLTDTADRDRISGMVWIKAGNNQAVLFTGLMGTEANDCYGTECDDACRSGEQGFHSYPYFHGWLWYKIGDLADVANSVVNAYDPQPYSTWKPSANLIDTDNCPGGSGGVAYQENYSGNDGRLFVAELGVDSTGTNEYLPVIHVFQISD